LEQVLFHSENFDFSPRDYFFAIVDVEKILLFIKSAPRFVFYMKSMRGDMARLEFISVPVKKI